MRSIGLALAAWLAGAAPGWAQDCSSAATQADITACQGRDAASADASLNRAYKTLTAMLAPEYQAPLREAQRAWLAFRDRECAFRTKAAAGGSIAPSLLSQCQAELTAARVTQLRWQLECQEGDAVCLPKVAAAPAVPPAAVPVTGDLDNGPCSKAVGMAKAKELVRQCLEMSGATHPPCNVANSCSMMIEEIRTGCDQSGAGAPAFCKTVGQ